MSEAKLKTYPDFTWEWIVQNCLGYCSYSEKQLQVEIDGIDPKRWTDIIETAQGTIAIVEKLREHHEVRKFVPMKSLLTLRWFPSNDLEISLYCLENKIDYKITISRRRREPGVPNDILETKTVGFDEVADEIYAYILKYDTP